MNAPAFLSRRAFLASSTLAVAFSVARPGRAKAAPAIPSKSLDPSAVDSYLSIDRDGQVFWNGQSVDADALESRLSDAAASITADTPELRLRADRQTPYEKVAQVMSAASRHGLTRLGFVTDPSEVSAR